MSATLVADRPDLSPRMQVLARNWLMIATRGAFAILFGLCAIVLPSLALQSLVVLFALYALLDGAASFTATTRAAAHHGRWSILAFESVVNLVAGTAALLLPNWTLMVFIFLLAAWSLISGLLLLAASLKTQPTQGRLFLAVGGLVSTVWGALLLLLPATGAAVLSIWMGCYALAFGAAMIALSLRLRHSLSQTPTSQISW